MVYNSERLEVAMATNENMTSLHLRRIIVTYGFCYPETMVLAIDYDQLRESLECDFASTKSSCHYKVNLYNLKATDEGLEGVFDGKRGNNIINNIINNISVSFTFYEPFCYSVVWRLVSCKTNSFYAMITNSTGEQRIETRQMSTWISWLINIE